MKRSEMITQLKALRFSVLWPENWKDIGFTERPIWINAHGFGYYSDDEPCNFVIIEGITDKDIADLKRKIHEGNVSINEIKSSPFGAVNVFDDDEYMEEIVNDFLFLPDHVDQNVFCGNTFDGWCFFSSEEELIDAFDKGDKFWGGEAWENMNDEELSRWYERVFGNSKLDLLLPMTLEITRTHDQSL